jgi:hypothetical protein
MTSRMLHCAAICVVYASTLCGVDEPLGALGLHHHLGLLPLGSWALWLWCGREKRRTCLSRGQGALFGPRHGVAHLEGEEDKDLVSGPPARGTGRLT